MLLEILKNPTLPFSILKDHIQEAIWKTEVEDKKYKERQVIQATQESLLQIQVLQSYQAFEHLVSFGSSVKHCNSSLYEVIFLWALYVFS